MELFRQVLGAGLIALFLWLLFGDAGVILSTAQVISVVIAIALILWTLPRRQTAKLERTLPPESEWPTVDIFVPCVNEDAAMIVNNVRRYFTLDYPASLLNVYLLMDAEREDLPRLLREDAGRGLRIVRRPNPRENFKAGNLNHALFHHAKSDLILLMDCDHEARPEALKTLLPYYFADPGNFGFVQAPDFPRNVRRDWLDFSFLGLYVFQGYFANVGGPLCVGTAVLFSRRALLAVGGFFEKSLTEDCPTGLRLSRDYRSYFCPEPISFGRAGLDVISYLRQRQRIADGFVQYFLSGEFYRPRNWNVRGMFLRLFFFAAGFLNLVFKAGAFAILVYTLLWPQAAPGQVVTDWHIAGLLGSQVYFYLVFAPLSAFQIWAFQRFIFVLSLQMAAAFARVAWARIRGRDLEFFVSQKGGGKRGDGVLHLWVLFAPMALSLFAVARSDWMPLRWWHLLEALSVILLLAPYFYFLVFPMREVEDAPPKLARRSAFAQILQFFVLPTNWPALLLSGAYLWIRLRGVLI